MIESCCLVRQQTNFITNPEGTHPGALTEVKEYLFLILYISFWMDESLEDCVARFFMGKFLVCSEMAGKQMY